LSPTGRKSRLPSLKGASTDISKQIDNETIFSKDLKSAKKHTSHYNNEQNNSSMAVRFPKLMNNKSLATDNHDETINTVD